MSVLRTSIFYKNVLKGPGLSWLSISVRGRALYLDIAK